MKFIGATLYFLWRYLVGFGHAVSELRMASGSKVHFWADTTLYILIGWLLMKATDNSNLLVAWIASFGFLATAAIWIWFMYLNNTIWRGEREWPAEDRNHWILDVTLCLVLMAIAAIRIAYLGVTVDALGVICLGYPAAYLVVWQAYESNAATKEGS